MKRRGISSREVTVSFHGKIIKIASQRKNERDLMIYAVALHTIFTKINFQYPSQKGS